MADEAKKVFTIMYENEVYDDGADIVDIQADGMEKGMIKIKIDGSKLYLSTALSLLAEYANNFTKDNKWYQSIRKYGAKKTLDEWVDSNVYYYLDKNIDDLPVRTYKIITTFTPILYRLLCSLNDDDSCFDFKPFEEDIEDICDENLILTESDCPVKHFIHSTIYACSGLYTTDANRLTYVAFILDIMKKLITKEDAILYHWVYPHLTDCILDTGNEESLEYLFQTECE